MSCPSLRSSLPSLLLLLLLLPSSLVLCANYYQHEQQQYGYHAGGAAARAVQLDQVKVLTLHRGRMTAGRRHAGVPQLKCVTGCEYEPEVVQCTNVGSDGRDVQWKCEADLPPHLRFGTTTVTCEGYEYPEDPRVLEGSCGLEYSLKRISGSQSGFFGRTHRDSEGSTFGSIFKWLVIAYILYMAYRVCAVQRSGRGPSPGPPRGWGGWGGFFPPSPPPPPPPPGFGDGKMGYGSTAQAGTSPWLAGAAGLGMGYMLGRRGNANAGWGGNFGGGGSGSWSSGSGSGSSRRATAFASTSRR